MSTNLGGDSLGNLVLGGNSSDDGGSLLLASASDTLVLSDLASSVYGQFGLNDTIIFSELLVQTRFNGIHDTITFSDSASNNADYLRVLATDTLTFNESMVFTGVFTKSASDTITFNELMVCGGDLSANATDTLTFTDEAQFTSLADITDTLDFTEDVVGTTVFHRSILDIVVFTESLPLSNDLNKKLLHILTFVERATFVHEIPQSITDIITLSDEVVREYHLATIVDTLILLETLTRSFIPHRTITSTLTLSEILHLQQDLVRLPSDTLNLNDRCYAVVADRYMLFFGVVNSIALPSPEFNDNYAMQGKTIIKRTMSGQVRTYNKTSEFEKLHYDFIVTRSQANAFRDFLITEFGNRIYIHDWEGRRYEAKLLSDDVAIEEIGRWEPCGNKVRFSIEFLGRLYA